MTIFNVISLLGGVGLFLFGMSLMGENLERVAGESLERLLEKLTNNRIKGFLLGVGVTAVIQSSAATTVMALGFVNAGIMKLVQAIPVVFGANIGSTVTAQILRFSGGDGDGLLLQLLKPSTLAPLLVCGAAFVMLISKKKQVNSVAGIFMGFGILFIGMTTMETALAPLSSSAEFQSLFTRFTNPFLGFLVGMVVTMILQSSSASVGILQALAFSTGSLTFSACLPIIVGQNVGKCITVVLGSLGTGKKAKRLAASHVCFNVFGAVIILSAAYALQAIFHFPFWFHVMTKGNIADTHLAFNVITSLILLPFVNQIADFTGLLIRGDKESKLDQELALLDEIFLDRPAIALEQSSKVINAMADTVCENYELAVHLLTKEWNDKAFDRMQENEDFLDKAETALIDYLVKVTSGGLSVTQSKLANELLSSVSDFERMGDYCLKIAEVVTFNSKQDIVFSGTGYKELDYIIKATRQTITETLTAFRHDDMGAAQKVEPLCETVEELRDTLKEHHINRLASGSCSTAAGISLVELVTSLDRIAAHCSNVTLHMMQKNSTNDSFDAHEEAHNIRHSHDESDIAMLQYYKNQYVKPVEELGKEHKPLLKDVRPDDIFGANGAARKPEKSRPAAESEDEKKDTKDQKGSKAKKKKEEIKKKIEEKKKHKNK